MKFLEKRKPPNALASTAGPRPAPGADATTTRQRGNAAEDKALAHLQAAGLKLAVRNYRTPGRGGGEIDLVMRDRDGTLVFVEVRSRASSAFGGAGGSISQTKQQRIIFAARHYLLRLPSPPPCRFDVVLVEDSVQWLKAAFDAQ
ncbi:MAG: YraN family protein [Acidovorax sp.]|uniref:YraN family protein n=1 Tax=Acidovorax sp. TaxID=1872122 RepID=UPI003919BCA8